MDIANKKADEFSREVYDKIKDQTDAAKIFAAFAAEKQLKAEATGVFSADAAKAGKFGSAFLVRNLAAIAASGDIWLSNVIADQDGFYVGFLTEYIPERQAEYKEVKDKVRADFIQSEAAKLAQKRAEAIIADLKKVSGKNRIARAKAATKEKFTEEKTNTIAEVMMQLVQLENLMQQNPQQAQMFMAYYMQTQQSLVYISGLTAMKTADISNALPAADGYKIIVVTAHKAPEKPYVANDEFTAFYKAMKSGNFQTALYEFVGANIQVSAKPEQGQAK
jgi:flagellar biosynthesis GTPase FlhF